MADIQVLPRAISELIAAGEVIDRPASVLKELTENAIDAGATHITAELKRGGVAYLRVTDDGCGIAPEQVRTAFLRHATSKIKAVADLEQILTLGFRGEALASVCAVSKTEVLTRQPDQELGTHYVIEGGEEQSCEAVGCPLGTTIVVRDLFYNVPVRAGFLKKDTAEGNAAQLVFQKIALSHPEISFRLIRENRTEFCTPGDGDLYSAMYAVLGKELAQDMLPVQYREPDQSDAITVEGYAIKPLYAKANRSQQLFFVNGRSVRSGTCTAAIEEAYKTLIMTGKYPACVLRIYVSPQAVDVNMHPTKAEVRFSDEKRIYSAVYFAVMNMLMQHQLIYDFRLPQTQTASERPASPSVTSVLPTPSMPKTDWYAPVSGTDSNTPKPLALEPEPKLILPDSSIPEPKAESTALPPVTPTKLVETVVLPVSEELAAFPALTAQPAKPVEPIPEPEPGAPAQPALPPIHVIGELFGTYILAEAGEQFVMMDKHAAHERILFERFRNRQCRNRQNLLTPATVLLTAAEADALQEQSEMLEQIGFSFSFAEMPIVKLVGVPMSCAELDLEQIVQELAEQCCLQQNHPDAHLLDDYFHTLACKAAIRSGDHSDLQELQSLAEQVWENDAIRHCPHGRPIVFLLSRYQIEKQFRRIQS